MKKITLRGIFLFILLIPSLLVLPSLAQAYTESFYVCVGGSGSAPEVADCDGAWDEGDFNSSRNWASIQANDGKIGPNDVVYFMDNGGNYTTELTVRASGTAGYPITLMPYSGDTVSFVPTSNHTSIDSGGNDYLTLDCDDSITVYTKTSVSSSAAAINFQGGEYVTVTNCIVDGSTTTTNTSSSAPPAIEVCGSGGNNVTVTNNTISDISLGIKCDMWNTPIVHYGTFSGNIISDVNQEYGNGCGSCDGIGVWGDTGSAANSDASGIVIENNKISEFWDDGIDVFTAISATVRYNEIGPVLTSSDDKSGIKIGGTSARQHGRDNIVYGNYIHDLDSPGNEWGINCNDSGGGSIIYANVLENIGGTAIQCHNSADSPGGAHIYNNTIVCESGNYQGIAISSQDQDEIYVRNNIIDGDCSNQAINIASSVKTTVYGGHNMMSDHASVNDSGGVYQGDSNDFGKTDPLLNPDVTLTSSSPAIDAGAYIGASFDKALLPGSSWPSNVVAIDPYMDGTGQEIGAYVYINNAEPAKGGDFFVSAKKDGVFIHSGPSTAYSIIRSVDSGYPLEILEQFGQWVRIVDFRGKQGWIYEPLICKAKTIVINVSSANLLKGPKIYKNIVAKLDYGSVMNVDGKFGKWLKISNHDGLEGWLYGELAWPDMK